MIPYGKDLQEALDLSLYIVAKVIKAPLPPCLRSGKTVCELPDLQGSPFSHNHDFATSIIFIERKLQRLNTESINCRTAGSHRRRVFSFTGAARGGAEGGV